MVVDVAPAASTIRGLVQGCEKYLFANKVPEQAYNVVENMVLTSGVRR